MGGAPAAVAATSASAAAITATGGERKTACGLIWIRWRTIHLTRPINRSANQPTNRLINWSTRSVQRGSFGEGEDQPVLPCYLEVVHGTGESTCVAQITCDYLVLCCIAPHRTAPHRNMSDRIKSNRMHACIRCACAYMKCVVSTLDVRIE
jgi:hypothetical protein